MLALCPGATETEFFARTGEQFLTDGRQTPKQVVDTALAALDKSTPTVVSGWRNAVLANGHRFFTPRILMSQLSEQLLEKPISRRGEPARSDTGRSPLRQPR